MRLIYFLNSRFYFSVRLTVSGRDKWLWYVEDDDFRYSSLLQLAIVENDRLYGIQLVIGLLLVVFGWKRP